VVYRGKNLPEVFRNKLIFKENRMGHRKEKEAAIEPPLRKKID